MACKHRHKWKISYADFEGFNAGDYYCDDCRNVINRESVESVSAKDKAREKEREDREYATYQADLRKEAGKVSDPLYTSNQLSFEEYICWLERKLFNNDIPVRE